MAAGSAESTGSAGPVVVAVGLLAPAVAVGLLAPTAAVELAVAVGVSGAETVADAPSDASGATGGAESSPAVPHPTQSSSTPPATARLDCLYAIQPLLTSAPSRLIREVRRWPSARRARLGNVVLATAVSVLVLAWSALIAGLITIVAAFCRIGHGFWATALSGGLLLVIGVVFLRNLGAAAFTLTLLAGALFLASGIARLIASAEPTPYRGALIITGIISVVLGLIVVFNLVTSLHLARGAAGHPDPRGRGEPADQRTRARRRGRPERRRSTRGAGLTQLTALEGRCWYRCARSAW